MVHMKKEKLVIIAVCTARPAQYMVACIQSLKDQHVPAGWSAEIVVVANNDKEDGAELLEKISVDSAIPITYHIEPVAGIPMVRNRGIEVALDHDADFIAFIDDDETAEDRWLAALCAAQEAFGCDAVQGPVEYVYPDGVPDWVTVKLSVDKRQHGASMATAATNNILFDCRLVRPEGLAQRFDDTFRFSGGSDADFFYRATDRGATIRWASDAIVRETVSPERLTQEWQRKRARRVAANNSVIHIRRKGLASALLRYVPKVFGRSVDGAARLLLGILLRPVVGDRAARQYHKGRKALASAGGTLMGLTGWMPRAYERGDARPEKVSITP